MKLRHISALLILALPVSAFAGKVNLVATINGGPAMTPVEWTVTGSESGNIVEETQRHSMTIELSPGTYTATAKIKDIVRSRTFTVGSSSVSNVIVAVD